MTFPVFPGSNPSGYNLTRSLRFRSSASAYLNRTPAGAGNQHTWTLNLWVKRGQFGNQVLISTSATGNSNSALGEIYFTPSDQLEFFLYDTSTVYAQVTTTQVFRDPSAWYMITIAYDDTQATAANRVKIYVNGSQVTSFATATYPSQNFNGFFNDNQITYIGKYAGTSSVLFDGYLAEFNWVDGQALTPSSFGSTNATTGVWQPAQYTGTYGTNGFYLPFTDNSALTTSRNVGLGKDFSGNGNYWTTNNISITAGTTYDSMTDVPTLTSATAANFAVLNPLDYSSSGTITDTNGNLTVSGSGAAYGFYRSTLAILTKTYFEVFCTSVGSGGTYIGVAIATGTISGTGICYYNGANGSVYLNGSIVATYATFTTNDIVGVTYDPATASVSFYKNNSLQGSVSTSFSGNVFAMVGDGSSLTVTLDANFGQRPFAYTPPTGYVALNTYNLPTSTIVKGNTVMDATLWTGNGATRSIVNAAGFQPDLVWSKARSAAISHLAYDSVRGATKYLQVNLTSAEGTGADSLTAFNSNGFSLGADTSTTGVNQNGTTYVGWQWQAGQGTTSSNTSGSITSTVSVNASAGFSVVTYASNGTSSATIGHGLGVAPAMIVAKQRSGTGNWCTYHSAVSGAPTNILYLNLSNAASGNALQYPAAPTSSVFSVGNGNDTYSSTSGTTYVAYCWTPIAGYSAFGSYTGNGSADGPFVYTGFRPKFVMIKGSSFVSNWFIEDSARNGYNVNDGVALRPNLSNAEDGTTTYNIDILSNGFKLRSSAGDSNSSGATFVYAAFAETPTKNALAR